MLLRMRAASLRRRWRWQPPPLSRRRCSSSSSSSSSSSHSSAPGGGQSPRSVWQHAEALALGPQGAARGSATPWLDARVRRLPEDAEEEANLLHLPRRGRIPREALRIRTLRGGRMPGMVEQKYYPHMGDDPDAVRVKATLRVDELPGLTEVQKARLEILATPARFNPKTREISAVCRRFPHRIENKRWLVLTMERLVEEACNPYYDWLEDEARTYEEEERKRLEETNTPSFPVDHGVPPMVEEMLGFNARGKVRRDRVLRLDVHSMLEPQHYWDVEDFDAEERRKREREASLGALGQLESQALELGADDAEYASDDEFDEDEFEDDDFFADEGGAGAPDEDDDEDDGDDFDIDDDE